MRPHLWSVVLAIAASQMVATAVLAYDSAEHKLLVDMGAAKLRIHPSILLPSPTRFGPLDPHELLRVHRAAKYLAVGFNTNDASDYSSHTKQVQDNSYWYGFRQREDNLKIHVPALADLPAIGLVIPGIVQGSADFTIGELAAIYGDYRRTTHCVAGDCYLTNANTATLTFRHGTDCFPPPQELFHCGWRPAPVPMGLYLKYIANGLNPPNGKLGNATGNTAGDAEYDDAGWWGDEMLRLANVNDWHFASGAVAWYVGMHRLALRYVDLARSDPKYWNVALHYEANALHSLTDRFAFGHMVTNRDRTSYGIMKAEGLLGRPAYAWTENVLSVGGGARDVSGLISISRTLPPIVDAAVERNDFMKSYRGNWALYALQENDFHNAFNGGGARVRNLKGDAFFIYGDKDLKKTPAATQDIIVEAVRVSLQSLFDAYLRLRAGHTVAEIGSAGSPFLAALKSIPIFVEENPDHAYTDNLYRRQNVGNNFNGQWAPFAQEIDALAGANVVPSGSPLPCVMQYVDGAIGFSDLASDVTPCTRFPTTTGGKLPRTGLPWLQYFAIPSSPPVSINFELPRAAFTKLEVFEVDGTKVTTLVAEVRPAGTNVARWDGTSDSGRPAPAGIYLYRITVEGRPVGGKLVLIR